MAKAATKKPKMLKYRKKPKASAPIKAWEKYDEHVRIIDGKNKERITKWTKAKNAHLAGIKKKETLIKKHSR